MACRLHKSVILAVLFVAVLIGDAQAQRLYRAFSLNEAQRRMMGSREPGADVLCVGGISRPLGLVYDDNSGDVILVGEVDAGEAPIAIEDVAVALRAHLKFGKVPEVSIDRTADTDRTGKQVVRFEGGIANTQFGKDLFDADVVLKKMGLGLLPTELWGVRSYAAMSAEDWMTSARDETVCSRFWFVPSDQTLVAVRSGVAVVDEIRIDVRTEVLGITGKSAGEEMHDAIGDRFAAAVASGLEDVASENSILRRLEPLFRLSGLAQGLAQWRQKEGVAIPGLAFWVEKCPVSRVETPKDFDLLKSESVGRQAKDSKLTLMIDGGIDMEMLISDWKDGSPTAFKQLVLAYRPKNKPLVWQVPLERLPDTSAPASGARAQSRAAAPAMTLRRQIFSSEGPRAALPTGVPDARVSIPRQPSFSFVTSLPPTRFSDEVGGIMLSGTAIVSGGGRSDLLGGNFSLIVEGQKSSLDPTAYRKFITALWAVYYSKEDPGISIDPIAWGVDKQLVRYIGRVINTDLGRVMREADYTMKKWAVGTERPDIQGFRDVDAISGMRGMTYADAFRRFWFVPEDITFKASDDVLLFESGKMTLKTELMLNGKSTEVVPSDQEFADFFTAHYGEIENRYPIYKELFEYAKMVSLAKYLKEKGIPLQWFLLAHLDLVLTEDSKGAVETLSKGSQFLKDFRIEGGVDMPGRYVLDQTASTAIQQAVARLAVLPSSRTTHGEADISRSQVSTDNSFELDKHSYSVVPQHSLSSGKDIRGIRYQTDIAVRNGNQPGLELIRYFRPVTAAGPDEGEFGKGWHLLIPYRVVPVGKPTIPFLNVAVPEKMVVRNLLTGSDEILIWDDSTYELAGYRPADVRTSRIIGLFWTVAGGLRLVDKIGNEFWFNEGLMLSEMHFSEDYGVRFEYDYEEATMETYGEAPCRLAAEGTDVVEDYVSIDNEGNERALPRKLRLTEALGRSSKVFIFGENESGLVGYSYEAASPLDRQFIALRADGRHILVDANGNETWFGRNLAFEKRRAFLVKALSQGIYRWNESEEDWEFAVNHSVKFDYVYDAGAFRIASAKLFKRGLSTPIHEVIYHYTDDFMLARVSSLARH